MANTHQADFARASSQYAVITNDLGITGGNITIEAWINVESAPASGNVYAIAQQQDAGTSVTYGIFYTNEAGTKKLYVERIKHGVVNNNASYTVDLGTATCYHVVLRYDGTDLKLFTAQAGGTHTERATVAGSGNGSATNNDHFVIAQYQSTDSGTFAADANNYPDMLIDDVRVWNTARTTTQLNDNFETELIGTESGLVAYYTLNNVWTDLTANAFNLTANGSPTFVTTSLCFTGAVASSRSRRMMVGLGT